MWSHSAGLEPGKIVPPPLLEKGWVGRSQSARCTESINSVHAVNNYTCMSVHFYNIMLTLILLIKDHMLDWQLCRICNPLEIKLLLLLVVVVVLLLRHVFS